MPTRQRFDFKNGVCHLEIVKEKGKATVVLTELADNTGVSVTNGFEKIATQVYKEFLSDLSVEDITWVEHYNQNSYRRIKGCPETFDQVILSWNPTTEQFHNPQWQPYFKPLPAQTKDSLAL